MGHTDRAFEVTFLTAEIHDSFDLEKICDSGQCFRTRTFEDGTVRFVSGEDVLYIRQETAHRYHLSCSEETWQRRWHAYFDLDRSYDELCQSVSDVQPLMTEAMHFGRGIRILRQDPWEMLLTFIISQRKSIPAIRTSVDKLCSAFGHRLETDREVLFTFPTPEELSGAGAEDLQNCALGYRTGYVLEAVRCVLTGQLDLHSLESQSDEQLLQSLMALHGVGLKVASCVGLFGYGHMGCVPVDVWIDRFIRQDCQGDSPFERFGPCAGIMQQYAFYYKKHHG